MELIQKEIRERLAELYRSNKVPHAMLFAGPCGVGKLHIAIEFARLLLCENSKDGKPCEECRSCRMSKELFHPDLLFYFPTIKKDGNDKKLSLDYLQTFVEFYKEHPFFSLDEWASVAFAEAKMPTIYNAEAVSLLEKIENKPSYGKRVIIFLCPELMGAECANRLLKSIEEPEGENNYIFISDHPGEILETIISRLQRIYFPPLTSDDIMRLIPGASDNLAKICRGNMCEALRLTNEGTEAKRSNEYFRTLMGVCYSRNIVSISDLCNDEWAKMSRKEQIGMLEAFLSILREIQIIRLDAGEASYLSEDFEVYVKRLAPFISDENIPRFMTLFSDAIVSISRNCQAKLVLFDMCLKLMMLMPRSR